MTPPVVAVCVLLAIMLGYARLLTWRHRREARRLGRRRRALERVEPFALGLLDGDAVLPRADDAAALNELLTGMAPTITGESRQAIADYFLSTGELDRAIAGLGDRRWPVRAAHAASLGDMCHARAEPALIARLGDGHPEVRLAAARSLGRLRSREAAEPLAEALVAGAVPRAVATASLLAIGPAALGVVRALVATDDPGRVEIGVDVLGQLGSSKDIPQLQASLESPVAAVRARACQAVGRLGDEEHAPELVDMLGDSDADVRAAAAAALAIVGTRSVATALIRVAQTDEYDVALTAAEAVSTVAPDLAVRVGRHHAASPALKHAASRVEASTK